MSKITALYDQSADKFHLQNLPESAITELYEHFKAINKYPEICESIQKLRQVIAAKSNHNKVNEYYLGVSESTK